jgi:hypothetical protein
MTGPEHYREAEECLAAMNGKGKDACNVLTAQAQVHATLALAAATALTTPAGVRDWEQWCDVTTVPRGGGRS